MHSNPFDHYHARNSPVHNVDPRMKVLLTFLYIISTALLPDGTWLAFTLSWILIVLISLASKIGFVFITKRSMIALPFALAAVTIIFTLPGQAIISIPLGDWELTATDTGLVRFISIMLRSWLSVQMAIILIATTQFPDLIHAMRHLRLPKIIVSTIAFMYRYAFVLTDETIRMLRAREARSARITMVAGGGSLLWRAKIAGNMAGQLFLRSYERSDRVYNAMVARGYQGVLLTMHPHALVSQDWIITLLFASLILSIQLVGRM